MIFDLDGTLVDTLPDLHHAINLVLEEEGLKTLAKEETRLMIGGGARNLIELAFAKREINADPSRIDAGFDRFLEYYGAQPTARSSTFPGVLDVLENLSKKGIFPTIFDARFAKPLDENSLWQIATNHEVIITLEEGSIGGFGSHINYYLNEKNLLDKETKFRSMILPDLFLDHDTPENMYKAAGLDAKSIENKVIDTLNSKIVLKKTN